MGTAEQDPALDVLPASEGAAARPAAMHPMAAMLSQNILRDGEIIILTLKPSLLYIPFSCLKFCAVVLILMIASKLWGGHLGYGQERTLIEIGTLVLLGRLTWSALHWMGRLYILTDQRIVSISGIFSADVFNCLLRKVARVRLVYTVKERLFGLGSIEIIPMDDAVAIHSWQTVSRVRDVHRQIITAMNRAKQGGCGG
ncbi:MAG TPA: PH domain-containing protein [Tepidisphaeraceae bacterium]|nr:PH domain-containing protein [Tepidisphaeraceae bacterium]